MESTTLLDTLRTKFQLLLGKKTTRNIAWFTGDKVIKILISTVVGSLVTRYLGPDKFGQLNYIVSYITIYGAISNFGLNQIIIRDLGRQPEKKSEILGTSFILKIFGSILAIALGFGIGVLTKQLTSSTMLLYYFLASYSYLFMAFEVFDVLFQTELKAKIIVKTRMAGFLIASLARVTGIFFGFPLWFFIAIFSLDFVIGGFLLAIESKRANIAIRDFVFSKSRALSYIRTALPIIIAGTLTVFYMRADKLILAAFHSFHEVGIYSAATKLSEIWFFIPVAISTVMAPVLAKREVGSEGFNKTLKKQLVLITYTTYALSLGTFLFSPFLIYILNGPEYMAASGVLRIHIWSLIFAAFGNSQDAWNTITNKQVLYLYRTIVGAIISIAAYYFLIPKLGATGAAIATTFSYMFPNFILNAFSKSTRHIFFEQLDALIPSVRNIKLLFET